MARETIERYSGTTVAGPPWWAIAFPTLALVLSGVLIAVGAASPQAGPVVAAAGALGVIVTVALLPLVIASARRAASPAEGLSTLREAIERVAEQQALSDDARRVIHRKRERELLRRAIEEDIAAQDWDAAMILVGELADRFGYRADAEEFRERVEQEAKRHGRYLGGFGLVRIGPPRPGPASSVLKEAVETETRRTDAACIHNDGSFVVLAAQVSDRGVEAIARRLETVAAEIAAAVEVELPELCAGVITSGSRRSDADELWAGLGVAFTEARQMGEDVVFYDWGE